MGGRMANSRTRKPTLRVAYRVRQTWYALTGRPDEAALQVAREVLTPPLWALFRQMPPNEQAHALRVLRRLQANGCREGDVLAAALLHDVGKALNRPRLWERVASVVAQRCCPQHARRWGEGRPRGWRRPFVIAQQHPVWGAELAAQAGASTTTVALIREHHTTPTPDLPWLAVLQAADDQE